LAYLKLFYSYIAITLFAKSSERLGLGVKVSIRVCITGSDGSKTVSAKTKSKTASSKTKTVRLKTKSKTVNLKTETVNHKIKTGQLDLAEVSK
jgi:hypothetical protein